MAFSYSNFIQSHRIKFFLPILRLHCYYRLILLLLWKSMDTYIYTWQKKVFLIVIAQHSTKRSLKSKTIIILHITHILYICNILPLFSILIILLLILLHQPPLLLSWISDTHSRKKRRPKKTAPKMLTKHFCWFLYEFACFFRRDMESLLAFAYYK